RHDIDQLAAPGEVRRPESGPHELVVEPVPRQNVLEAPNQRFAAALGTEPEIEHGFQRAGYDIRRARARMDVGALPGGRREVRIPVVPSRCGELRQDGRCQMDRIARKLRIGDVSLDAFDGQRAGQGAAPSVLDHVAESIDRRRLADDAEVDALAGCRELLDYL